MTFSDLLRRIILAAFTLALVNASVAQRVLAQSPPTTAEPDGRHDFDWEIGAWDTYARVRPPLSETSAWGEFRGVSVVQTLAAGRSNLVELDIADGQRRISGVALRLYNPQARQWSLNYASMANGLLTAPVYGGFENGRGVFYGQDVVESRVVQVRFVISDITADTARFVQSYSVDGGRTWIDNWIALDTRALPAPYRNEH